MQTVIILIHLMIVLAMVGLVLIQKSEGGGLGMGGGSGGGFMSNRGTANVLTRATGILAALFFATSLFLSILAGYDRKPSSIVGTPASQTAPVSGGATPVQPPTSGGVLDTLKKVDEQQQNRPAPTGPEAPRSQ